MQHKHRNFLLFYLFPICDLVICSSFYNLLYLCYGYYYEKNLLGEWWASRWRLTMRKWDGDGTRQEQERAKVLGACVIYTESSNRQASRGTFSPWPLRPQDARQLELSVCITHAPCTFACSCSCLVPSLSPFLIVMGRGWPWGSEGFGDFFKGFLIIGQILFQMLYCIERKWSCKYYLNVY